MFDAARNGDSVLLVAAIEAGLPVNLSNDKGCSRLQWASRNIYYNDFQETPS
jgi:hypothetical protein